MPGTSASFDNVLKRLDHFPLKQTPFIVFEYNENDNYRNLLVIQKIVHFHRSDDRTTNSFLTGDWSSAVLRAKFPLASHHP